MSQGESVHGIVIAGVYPAGSALDQLVPRPLLPVAQQPLITYALRWMSGASLQSATICANSGARTIRASLNGAALGLRLDYLEDWSPRGAAGCVRDAAARTGARTFVVADGTAVPVVDLGELVRAHRASEAALTVVVGADATGRLRPSGVYVFDRRAFDFIPADGFQDIKEKLIPRLYDGGRARGHAMASRLGPRVVNTDIVPGAQPMGDRAGRTRQSGARGLPDRAARPSCTRAPWSRPGARLLGPVLLGPRVSVGAGATLVGPVSLGPGTTVGRDAVVSRSVVWSGCTVGDRAFVDR